MAKGKGGFLGQDGLNAPDQATGVTASGGSQQATVSFTSPSDNGGSAITGYRVQDSTGAHAASGTSSPITVTGLTNGTSYTFNVWAINAFGWSAPSEATDSVTPQATRALWSMYGFNATEIEYVTVETLGDTTDFGDSTQGRYGGGSVSSSTRGVWAAGYTNTYVNTMDYVTIATTGNANDFGDYAYSARWVGGGVSNGTRGVFSGGYSGSTITQNSYITIASTGNASNFGSTDSNASMYSCGAASPTRGVFAGYQNTSFSNINNINYITIANTGNASDFGDLSATRARIGAFGSDTRAVFGGGAGSTSTIDYITTASTGNATDFGDMLTAGYGGSGTSSNTRGIFGGYDTVQLQYVTIATTGNAADFGDQTQADRYTAACSSNHGGLQ
mgnify:CR=1 FL=1